MTVAENPFTPSFGEVPAVFAGRQTQLAKFRHAFQSEIRRPELTTIFSGARGTGKTSLLYHISQLAEERGWIAVNVTAMPGMLDDIESLLKRNASHLLAEKSGARISSIGIPQVLDIELADTDAHEGTWRVRMEALLDQLSDLDCGLLITVDEVNVELPEMVQLASAYQHFVQEGRRVSLLMAGLPQNTSSLINDRTVSFLRRARFEHLGRIDDDEIREALKKTVASGDRGIEEQALDDITQATDGFPYLMQLIGYETWEVSPDQNTISSADAQEGVRTARRVMKTQILEATYLELSEGDVKFLQAMTEDEGSSLIADIEKRLTWSSSQVAQYRSRLIERGVIGARRRGVVGFDMPFFREYLLEDR